jgi:hypothetical protein
MAETMSEREMLLASLVLVNEDAGGVYFDYDQDYDGRYIDWSCKLADGGRQFEVGDGTEGVQLELTRAELVRLHAALTRLLLAEQA